MQNDTYTPKTFTTAEKMQRISNALAELNRQVADLQTQVAELDKAGICTGVVYWRRENGKLPKLYANHSTGETCPIHGEPPPGGRLRAYIGLDPGKQAEVQAAIKRRMEKDNLQHDIGLLEMQYSRIEHVVTNAYYAASNQQRWEW